MKKILILLFTLFSGIILCSCGQENPIILKSKLVPGGEIIFYNELTGNPLNGKYEFTKTSHQPGRNFFGEYVSEEINFKNGQYHGEFIEYYPDGSIAKKLEYRKGKLNGEAIRNNSEGQIIENYEDGQLDGKRIAYYKNKEIKFKEKWEKGKENGDFIYYYPNGEIESEGEWNNGKKDGNFIFYYSNGKIKIKESWDNGNMDGKYFEYFEDGKVKIKGKYRNGEKNGVWEINETLNNTSSYSATINYKENKIINCEIKYNYTPSSTSNIYSEKRTYDYDNNQIVIENFDKDNKKVSKLYKNLYFKPEKLSTKISPYLSFAPILSSDVGDYYYSNGNIKRTVNNYAEGAEPKEILFYPDGKPFIVKYSKYASLYEYIEQDGKLLYTIIISGELENIEKRYITTKNKIDKFTKLYINNRRTEKIDIIEYKSNNTIKTVYNNVVPLNVNNYSNYEKRNYFKLLDIPNLGNVYIYPVLTWEPSNKYSSIISFENNKPKQQQIIYDYVINYPKFCERYEKDTSEELSDMDKEYYENELDFILNGGKEQK